MAWLRPLLAPGLATLAGLAVLISLGVWQLERRAWKAELIARIEARAFAEPADIPRPSSWPVWRAADDEFRRVRVSGTFLHDREIAVHGLARQGGQPLQGFYIFTPLRLASGAVVLVNRGIVPTERRGAARRAPGQVAGETTVVGLVRAPEKRSWFVPENDAGRDEWFVRDLAAMARARGLDRVAPFYIDADATPNPGGWPQGGHTPLALPNNHLQYVLTWFGLAVTLAAVFAVFARRRLAAPADEAGTRAPGAA